MSVDKQPVTKIQWVDRDKLQPNDYNPNRVAPPELKLLKVSILEDGWTQPIVINEKFEIVDGYHRWTVSGDKKVAAMTGGKVPVVILKGKDKSDRQMATIRHNRARGTHAVLEMSDIVIDLVDSGLSGDDIMERLQMEEEEVTRLLFRAGIPKSDVFEEKEFGNAWEPE